MNNRILTQLNPKFVTTYTRLLTAGIEAVGETPHLWKDLLALPIEADFLRSTFQRLSKGQCLGSLKTTCNSLFSACFDAVRNPSEDEVRRAHALQTLLIFTRTMLEKNLSGWEVMEVFAGGVSRSDEVFMALVSGTSDIIADEGTSIGIRHQVLQLAIVFACGISQLSPVAYFLRKDLFPSIAIFMQSPVTEKFSFEAVMFFSVLANYHRSDAAKLNPYMLRLKETNDVAFMRKTWWAANFALEASVKTYQDIVDDSPPTLVSSIGSMMASMRPDRALAAKPVDLPRDLFKNQPIEATVVLLPIHDFLRLNATFPRVMLEYLHDTTSPAPSSFPFTILTLSSYLLCHASSSSSSRAISYAHLSLNILLSFSQNKDIMDVFSQPGKRSIRLCRQRMPDLPILPSSSPAMCALVDCCVLWLRHNLHMKLEVSLYSNCVAICQRTIQFLLNRGTRLAYHWTELWKASLGLITFLTSKLENLNTTGGVEKLLRQTLDFLDTCLSNVERFLPSPHSVHEFIYELIRSSSALQKLSSILESLKSAPSSLPSDRLAHIMSVVDHYEALVAQSRSRSANGAMRIVAKEIEKDGVWGVKEADEDSIYRWDTRNLDTFNFSRYVCSDTLALMP